MPSFIISIRPSQKANTGPPIPLCQSCHIMLLPHLPCKELPQLVTPFPVVILNLTLLSHCYTCISIVYIFKPFLKSVLHCILSIYSSGIPFLESCILCSQFCFSNHLCFPFIPLRSKFAVVLPISTRIVLPPGEEMALSQDTSHLICPISNMFFLGYFLAFQEYPSANSVLPFL